MMSILHNRSMRLYAPSCLRPCLARPFAACFSLTRLCLVLLLLAAAGCTRAPMPLPGIARGDGRVEWQGTAPCADCVGIETRLVLERTGAERRYVLVEIYVDGAGGTRFVDQGTWEQDAALLHLLGATGGRRTYALLEDSRLQARDSHGRALPVQDGALLSPVGP
jgi:NlpE-like protein